MTNKKKVYKKKLLARATAGCTAAFMKKKTCTLFAGSNLLSGFKHNIPDCGEKNT